MDQHCKPFKVAIKYCGCCNPQVDLSRIARGIADMIETGANAVLVPFSEDKIDMVVILCGCPRACGNKVEVKVRAEQYLVVAGESVNGNNTHEKYLIEKVQQELERIFCR